MQLIADRRSIWIVICIILFSISVAYWHVKTKTIAKNPVTEKSFEQATDAPWQPTAWGVEIENATHGSSSRAQKGKAANEFNDETLVATLQNKAYSGVYELAKEVEVLLKVSNYEDHELPVMASWELRRLPDGEVSQGKISFNLASQGSVQAPLPFPSAAGYGLYEYRVHISSSKNYKIESEARVV